MSGRTTGAHVCDCGSAHLTCRDVEILLLLATGLTGRQIGQQLGISPRTVEDHVSRMRHRVEAQGVGGLLTRCYAAGILIPGWLPHWSGSYCLHIDHSQTS